MDDCPKCLGSTAFPYRKGRCPFHDNAYQINVKTSDNVQHEKGKDDDR